MNPIGVYGGTFDPVHNGHVSLAAEAAILLGLKKVIWIPAGRPPHRGDTGAQPLQRLDMVRLAIKPYARFEVDDSEVLSMDPSYTVKTLERLRALYGPEQQLVLLVGADAFNDMDKWYRAADLPALAHIAVSCRPGYSISKNILGSHHVSVDQIAESPAGGVTFFVPSPINVSATRVRERCRAGKYISRHVPFDVMLYIRQNGLYQNHHS